MPVEPLGKQSARLDRVLFSQEHRDGGGEESLITTVEVTLAAVGARLASVTYHLLAAKNGTSVRLVSEDGKEVASVDMGRGYHTTRTVTLSGTPTKTKLDVAVSRQRNQRGIFFSQPDTYTVLFEVPAYSIPLGMKFGEERPVAELLIEGNEHVTFSYPPDVKRPHEKATQLFRLDKQRKLWMEGERIDAVELLIQPLARNADHIQITGARRQ